MKLYYAAGVYIGTQADAKRLDKNYSQVEVPTDKDGLMAFLNRHKIAPQNAVDAPPAVTVPEAEEVDDLLAPEPAPQPARRVAMDAGSVISRIDTPGIDVMIEAIGVSKGQSLRRFAGAVAIRFEELARG